MMAEYRLDQSLLATPDNTGVATSEVVYATSCHICDPLLKAVERSEDYGCVIDLGVFYDSASCLLCRSVAALLDKSKQVSPFLHCDPSGQGQQKWLLRGVSGRVSDLGTELRVSEPIFPNLGRSTTAGFVDGGIVIGRLISLDERWAAEEVSELGNKPEQTSEPRLEAGELESTLRINGDEIKTADFSDECDLLRYSLSECQRIHQHDICIVAPSADGLILVDVELHCLTRTLYYQDDEVPPYVALSYVAGGSSIFRTENADINQLRRPYAFDIPALSQCLPAAFRDGIKVSRALGLRYVWIDALCIVHDDPSHRQGQIENMAAVYSRALFVIVLLYSPNPTVHSLGEEDPRLVPWNDGRGRRIWAFGPEPVNFPMRPYEKSYHEARAWTYQETFMANRVVYLTPFGPVWRCLSKIYWTVGFPQTFRYYCEASTDDVESVQALSFQEHADIQAERERSMHIYSRSVSLYFDRQLTFTSDRIRAFAGVAQAFSKLNHTQFHYGLPECMFDFALWWHLRDQCPLERTIRITVDGKTSNKFLTPSWSWAGVDYRYHRLLPQLRKQLESNMRRENLIDSFFLLRGDQLHKLNRHFHSQPGQLEKHNEAAIEQVAQELRSTVVDERLRRIVEAGFVLLFWAETVPFDAVRGAFDQEDHGCLPSCYEDNDYAEADLHCVRLFGGQNWADVIVICFEGPVAIRVGSGYLGVWDTLPRELRVIALA